MKNIKYSINKNKEFQISSFNQAKTFSSFFPAVAGVYGIPMWVFYVNRGQAIASFGIKDKDHAILEFQPANKSYETIPLTGFRTFIKLKKKDKIVFYEPFRDTLSNSEFDIDNTMKITSHDLKLEEVNKTLGIKVTVEYFTVPEENFSALARTVRITNLNNKKIDLEVIDGLPKIVCYGVNNWFLKHLSRTVEAWMRSVDIFSSAFFNLRVDPTDSSDINHIHEGNFYLSFIDDKKLIAPIVESSCIFGSVNDFSYPKQFLDKKRFNYPLRQITDSKTPCAFTLFRKKMGSLQDVCLKSLIGVVNNEKSMKSIIDKVSNEKYFLNKKARNKEIIDEITSNIFTVSSSVEFNQYCRQTYLDNILRGGFPLTVESNSHKNVFYVYSRIHGDLERDYNNFQILPSYFSQGNGNYRDVNQNRRCDNWFNINLDCENIIALLSLIQLDGYNPLVLKGAIFELRDNNFIDNKLKNITNSTELKKLRNFLVKPFSPGHLMFYLKDKKIKSSVGQVDLFLKIIASCAQIYEAEHKEGFWSDHWSYNTDLLESYLNLYPEKLKKLLLEEKSFTFFDNAYYVKPRAKRYVLKNNLPRQLNCVALDKKKQGLIRERGFQAHLVRTDNGKGQIYYTNLVTKLVCIVVNKLATLDPFNTGIEMESDKPNWFDSLNGLPGLFGSSSCETFELKRLVDLLICYLEKIDFVILKLPQELVEFLNCLSKLIDEEKDGFKYWDKANYIKEDYRAKVHLGLKGEEVELSKALVLEFLDKASKKLSSSIKNAFNSKERIYNTYFINELVEFDKQTISEEGFTVNILKPVRFKQRVLANFLEAQMHALRIEKDIKKAKQLYANVRNSNLYDKRLKMYKVCASLEKEALDIGRVRVFIPGWLENESIWLHMEYKYLLELLRTSLFDEFFAEFKNVLICFQDPHRYGRSILENSSFLVSSANPDENIWGNGFVARLSGSTAEFLNIWLWMCAGKNPFTVKKNELTLEFKPTLKSWLFTQKKKEYVFVYNGKIQSITIGKNCFAFNFLSRCLVVYHNPKRKNTFGKNAAVINRICMFEKNISQHELDSGVISASLAQKVRDGFINRIDVYLS
ncbi:MAG: hypothetical protein P9L96_05325 [Candidatus Gygaella obscura]|nr:hypothetical protein [Candidatus Gygaella obscura]